VSEQPSGTAAHPLRSPRRRMLLAGLLGAAAMALAVPISGVFASDGGSSSGGSRPSAVHVQDGGQNAPAPRRHNCPHRDGGQGGGGSSSSDTSLQQF
jgi:hypothetical protein